MAERKAARMARRGRKIELKKTSLVPTMMTTNVRRCRPPTPSKPGKACI